MKGAQSQRENHGPLFTRSRHVPIQTLMLWFSYVSQAAQALTEKHAGLLVLCSVRACHSGSYVRTTFMSVPPDQMSLHSSTLLSDDTLKVKASPRGFRFTHGFKHSWSDEVSIRYAFWIPKIPSRCRIDCVQPVAQNEGWRMRNEIRRKEIIPWYVFPYNEIWLAKANQTSPLFSLFFQGEHGIRSSRSTHIPCRCPWQVRAEPRRAEFVLRWAQQSGTVRDGKALDVPGNM